MYCTGRCKPVGNRMCTAAGMGLGTKILISAIPVPTSVYLPLQRYPPLLYCSTTLLNHWLQQRKKVQQRVKKIQRGNAQHLLKMLLMKNPPTEGRSSMQNQMLSWKRWGLVKKVPALCTQSMTKMRRKRCVSAHRLACGT